jgi:hypothetical protein
MLQTKYLDGMNKSELSNLLLEVKKKLMQRNFDEDVSENLEQMLNVKAKKCHRRQRSLQPRLRTSSSSSSIASIR